MRYVGWFWLSISSALMMVIGNLYGMPLLYKRSFTKFFTRETVHFTHKATAQGFLEPARNIARLTPWLPGELPRVAAGLTVSVYAAGLNRPRWLYTLPNGDVLVAETGSPDAQTLDPTHRLAERVQSATEGQYSANRIILLRDSTGAGLADLKTPFLCNMYLPFGMALIGNNFYVATADAITRYPYEAGQTQITAQGTHIVNLPLYGHNWAKNILPSQDGHFLYVTLDKTTKKQGQLESLLKKGGTIMRLDLRTQDLSLFSTDLPSVMGMAQDPQTALLWVVLNDFRTPYSHKENDYITSLVQNMPWLPTLPANDIPVSRRIVSGWATLTLTAQTHDYKLGSYTGAAALVFSYESNLPETWRHGLFVSERGSWAHRPKHGYKIVYIPFKNGKPYGKPQDVMTGFLNPEDTQLRGRPMGLALDGSGALLVADDIGNIIWRITAAKDEKQAQ